MGPTSGAHHDCSLKRTLGQRSADQNGTRALTTVVAALNQGLWVGDQGTEKYCNGRALYQGLVDSHNKGARAWQQLRARASVAGVAPGEGVAAGVAPGGGSDSSCRRWRREQGRRKQKRQWLRALAMAHAGSAMAQVAGEGKDMK